MHIKVRENKRNNLQKQTYISTLKYTSTAKSGFAAIF